MSYCRFAILVLLAISLLSCKGNKQAENAPYLPFRFLVLAPGSFKDDSENQRSFEALQRISTRLKLRMSYRENIGMGSIESVIDESGSKFDFVLGLSSQVLPSLIDIATKHPNVKSAFIGHYPGNFGNLGAVAFQPSHHYLVGVIAGLKTKTGRVGALIGNEEPLSVEEINAFNEGVRRVNPEVICYTTNIGGKHDKRAAFSGAASMLKNNVDVLFVNCGAAGNDLYKWGELNKVMTIGSVEDQYSKAPGWVLTSVITNYDKIFNHAIEQMLKGQWQGGFYRFGTAEKATDIASLRGTLTKNQEAIFNQAYREIAQQKGDISESQ